MDLQSWAWKRADGRGVADFCPAMNCCEVPVDAQPASGAAGSQGAEGSALSREGAIKLLSRRPCRRLLCYCGWKKKKGRWIQKAVVLTHGGDDEIGCGSGSGSQSVNRCAPVAARSSCIPLVPLTGGSSVWGGLEPGRDLLDPRLVLLWRKRGIKVASRSCCCYMPLQQDLSGSSFRKAFLSISFQVSGTFCS